MPSKLSIKLLLPNLAIGLVFIFVLLFMSEPISKVGLVSSFCALVLVQGLVNCFYFEQLLAARLVKLQGYLNVVVSTEEAPDEPLTDNSNDELAKVTNSLSDFIVNLADVVSLIRQESEELRQGSTQLSNQMSDSVALVEDSAGQISQMAVSIEEVANTSSSLFGSVINDCAISPCVCSLIP